MTFLAPNRPLLLLCVALSAVVLAGCGPEHGATVHGVATVDGKPLEYGNVQFHAVGGGAIAYGTFRPAVCMS